MKELRVNDGSMNDCSEMLRVSLPELAGAGDPSFGDELNRLGSVHLLPAVVPITPFVCPAIWPICAKVVAKGPFQNVGHPFTTSLFDHFRAVYLVLLTAIVAFLALDTAKSVSL